MEDIRENMLELIRKISNKEYISTSEYILPEIAPKDQELLTALVGLRNDDDELTNLKNITKQIETNNIDHINELAENLTIVKNELKASNLELENLFSSIKDMLIVLDENKIITKVNHSVTCTLGYESSEILNNKFASFFNLEKTELFEFLHEGKTLNEIEVILTHCNKIEVPTIMSGVRMLDDSGNLQGYVIKIVDARESRLAKEIQFKQEQLIQSEKLASLGQMAGGIAHEINNPLTIISAKAGLLQMKLEMNDIDPEYFKSSLEIIKGTITRISSIISNLKTFSRDSTKDKKGWYSVKEIINNTLSFCDEKFMHNGIIINVDIPDDTKLFCQNVLVSQIVMNLLNNSFDAINLKNEKWIKFETESTNEVVRLIYTDSGNGIDVEICDQIFEPFFTTKNVGHGTGLGLSLVSETMKKHNGKIFVNQKIKNTQFVLEFPNHDRLNKTEGYERKIYISC